MSKSNFKKMILMGCSLCAVLSQAVAQHSIGDQLQLKWQVSPEYNGKDNLDIQLILKNISSKPIDLKTWDLWFNALFPVEEKKTPGYAFVDAKGNLYKLQFAGQIIPPHDSLAVTYQTKYPIANISTVPNGFYLQDTKNSKDFVAVNNVVYKPIQKPIAEQIAFNMALYDKNDRLTKATSYPLIFPTPSAIKVGKEAYTLNRSYTLFLDPQFGTSSSLSSTVRSVLGEGMQQVHTPQTSAIRVLYKASLPAEGYHLRIHADGIQIEAQSPKGAFYALQSIRSMLPAVSREKIVLPYVEVEDQPRFAYRGFMLDIARNFRDKETILRYLDMMAAYKLNVFHLHMIDDEGWRIEIPSLPELVEIGANRSPEYLTGSAIPPAYGSGAKVIGPQYLTRADFIEIIKYANERFITVVPEIETPGHARAAIKAMEVRYNRLKAEGKLTEAEKYLLHDMEDASVYRSVQYFDDNTLNPALPSVYTFISTVLDDIKQMYTEAGVPLQTVSLGGDEVANGVWEKSPKIQQLMREKNFTSVHQVWPYYIERINAICADKGIKLAGWEEIGMVNKGKGMVVNTALPNKQNMQLDVWNNVIGGGQEDLVYRLANAGYPTVSISASNMYFDMMWNTNFEEPGLKWATYSDLYHSYAYFPEDFFANIDTYYSGKRLGKAAFKDKVRLDASGKKNFIGIKGGIFSETLLSAEALDYMVFPRFFALAERAWSPKKDYEDEVVFTEAALEKDYAQFVQRIATVDLPKISGVFQFRLPAVGVKAVNGVLLANTEYPNFTIYYTRDGSKPSLKSTKYSPGQSVKIRNGEKYAFAVVDDQGRVGPISYFN